MEISTANSLTDLADQLAGAEVEITIAKKSVTGRMVGVQDQQVGGEGESITEQHLVVLTDAGLQQFSLRQIENVYFRDATIRLEIDKSLNRRLREIKRNSTFVELELSAKGKGKEAIIQYTIPAAAWKISYRMLINDGAAIDLHGHAIVDNNTDEDWENFQIAVVMGQPITFSTDLAESKIPHRGHVNVVQESAIGSVEVEEAIALAAAPMGEDLMDEAAVMRKARPQMMKRTGGMRSRAAAAEVSETDVTESGDFCVFESTQPVSIAANRSAIIPVFQNQLAESKPVLHYKLENNVERPFRAIEFKNTTSHSLGRGVCTVYDQTTYAGNCILPAVPAGGSALLPHALETAVKIRHQSHKIESRRIGLRISAGVAFESYHKLLRTEYLINSQRDEKFTFVLDHAVRLAECKVVCHLARPDSDPVELTASSLKNGRRIEFELLPNDVVTIAIIETCVAKSQVLLTGIAATEENFQVQWLYDNLIDSNYSLAQTPAVMQCIELQKRLDEKNSQIQHGRDELQGLIGRQERLRKNLKTGSGDHQTAKWQDDLARAEDNIVQLEEEHMPDLIVERDECRQDLFRALQDLAIEWSE